MPAVRTTKVSQAVVNGSGVLQPNIPVTATLIPPPGAGPLLDLNGEVIDLTPIVVLTNIAGVYTFDPAASPVTGLIAPGDITPTGCQWQIDYLQTSLKSDSFAYTAGTITPSSWAPAAPIAGLIRMYLTMVEGNATPDQAGSIVFSLNQDAIWAGGIGTGQVIGQSPLPTLFNDSSGTVYSYFVPNLQQTPNTTYWKATLPSGQALSFLCPTNYTNGRGVWDGATTFALNDVVTVAGVPYISLQAANLNHAPASSPSWWSPYIGERITAYLTTPIPATALGGSIPPTFINHSGDVPTQAGDPEPTPANLSDDLENLAHRIAALVITSTVPAGAMPYYTTPWGRQTIGSFAYFP